MINISEEFFKQGFVFDKTTQDIRKLPYDREACYIASNEFVKNSTINKKIEYLHKNFLFLYKLSNVADFSVPAQKTFDFEGNDLFLYEGLKKKELFFRDSLDISASKLGALSFYRFSNGGSLLFYSSDTLLESVFISADNVERATKTAFIDPLSGTIAFQKIGDIKTDQNENLYIADVGYKNIYQYTIKPVLTRENIYRKLPFLKNATGGPGTAEDRTKFGNIRHLAVNDNYVIAEDDVNKCFKVFDKNLNWLRTTKLLSLFDEIKFFDCIVLSSDNKLYCCRSKLLYIFALDYELNIFLERTVDMTPYLEVDEFVSFIKFGYTFDNIFYLFTDRAIKKIWRSDPTGCIGEYKVKDKIAWADVFAYDGSYDQIILKTETVDGNYKLFGFLDNTNILTLLANRDFEIYGLDDVRIEKNEYVTSWVIQKSIKKIFTNHSIFIKQIKFKLLEDNNTISIFKNKLYNQLFLNYTSPSPDPINLNIGINEIFQAEVINRIIEETLNLQRLILLYVLNSLKTKKYLSPNPAKLDEFNIFYTYFTDDSLNLVPTPAKLVPFEELAVLDGLALSTGGAPYEAGEGISINPGIVT
jgi:hypothetical protein